jgi:hypothetical protein
MRRHRSPDLDSMHDELAPGTPLDTRATPGSNVRRGCQDACHSGTLSVRERYMGTARSARGPMSSSTPSESFGPLQSHRNIG